MTNLQENHGLFTKYLLRFLTQPNLDIEDMFKEVRQGVIQESRAQQVPWTASSLIGTFHVCADQDASSPSLPVIQDEPKVIGIVAGRSFGSNAHNTISVPPNRANVDMRAHIDQAISMAKLSHFSEAISLLQDVLSIWPESSVALRLLGLLLHHVGRDTEAFATFDRALQLNGKDAPAAAYQCAMQGIVMAAAAHDHCELAARTNPSAETYLALAFVLTAVGDGQGASGALDISLSLGPQVWHIR